MMHNTPSTRAALDQTIEGAPAYLRPLFKAVRDDRCGLLFIGQSAAPFDLPVGDCPAIILIGDDFDQSVGPARFDLPSLRQAIRACDSFAIVSSAPVAAVYALAAATAAIGRRNAMLIETRPEHERAWLAIVREEAPGKQIWLATVKGGAA